jgi:hypothetical protein
LRGQVSQRELAEIYAPTVDELTLARRAICAGLASAAPDLSGYDRSGARSG